MGNGTEPDMEEGEMDRASAMEEIAYDRERITFLEKELDRAYRALCGYVKSIEKNGTIDRTLAAYHCATVAAAKRHTILGEKDGSAYFEGKHVSVLHEALAL